TSLTDVPRLSSLLRRRPCCPTRFPYTTLFRSPLAKPLIYEASLGLGYTPTHGDLAEYQRTTFVSGSSGLRWRFWGRQSLYGNVFYHSPYYHDTTIPPLDRRELSFDFGWMLATRT